jgi:hypothetical protein
VSQTIVAAAPRASGSLWRAAQSERFRVIASRAASLAGDLTIVKVRAPSRPQRSGPVSYVRSIRVEDASGAQFELHQFEKRRFITKARWFQLDTGERAQLMDDETFALITTGERLMPV